MTLRTRHQEAELLIGLGRFEEAEARLEPLTREWRAEPDSTGSLAAVLISRGKLRVLQRQGARAVPLLDEAQRLLQPLAWHPARLAEVAFLLAQAQAQAGHHAEALAQAQSALALYEKASKPDDVQAVEVWMKAHR